MRGSERIAIEAVPSAVAVVDAARVVRAHNARFERFASKPVAAGAPIDDVLGGDAAVLRLVDAARDGREASLDRHARTGPDGRLTRWLVRVGRSSEGVVLLADDVSDAAAADEALRAATHDYVGLVAHELRGPLSAIRGWAGALASRLARVSEAERERAIAETLGTIARQVDRMGALLADLLEVARVDAGRLAVARRSTGLAEALEGALSRVPGKRPVLVRPWPACDVEVDPFVLELVLARVCERAAPRATSPPPVVRVERAAAQALVTVAGERPDVADAFARFPRGGARRDGGTGLGLAAAQLLAAALGARLWLEPDGALARYVLALPVHAKPARRVRQPSSRRASPARAAVLDATPARARARVALLRRAGWDATPFADAMDALAAVERAPHELVLADAALLGLDGLARLAGRPGGPDVVLCAAGPVGAPGAAERLGARAVVVEPADPAHLVALLGAIAASRAPSLA